MKNVNPKMAAIGAALVLLGFVIGIAQPFIDINGGGDLKTAVVNGTATVKAEPDEFVFYPYYTSTSKTKATATADVTKLGDKAVAEIKKLGVAENKIKVDITTSEDYKCFTAECSEPTGYIGTYTITINSTEKSQADKLQAYLLKSGAEGSVTPSATFSEAKLQEIKAGARSKAVENAKAQAGQIADELDSKLGKVQSIEEVSGFDMPVFMSREAVAMDSTAGSASSQVYAGEQEITFTVKATFEIK